MPYSEDLKAVDTSFLIFLDIFPSVPPSLSVLPIIISSPLTLTPGQIMPSLSSLVYIPCLIPVVICNNKS